jgi:hypothetical protein
MQGMEKELSDYFTIEKREIITINVKHAMELDKDRIDKVI